MKDDIHELGDSFKQEIFSCKSEEDSLRKIKEKYEKLFSILQANNKKRIKVIKKIRLNKIKEINDEYEKSKLELKELKEEANSILSAYCDKNGHSDILINSRMLGYTRYSFSRGYECTLDNLYKCAVCGRKINYIGTGYSYFTGQKYERKIPDDIYDDTSLTKNGKTFRMVQEEILKTNQYINYLKSLCSKLCELFGHDAKRGNIHGERICECCGRTISYTEYANTLYNAKYRGIVSFYGGAHYPDKGYIISSTKELDLSLPTFEDYQKNIELEQNKIATQTKNDNTNKLTKKRVSRDNW